MIKAVVFDFGGVLAEEGFRQGLSAIGEQNNLDPDDFVRTAENLVYQTGYVTGDAEESTYWQAVREKTGIHGSDRDFREELFRRFIMRNDMIQYISALRSSGFVTAILSDQTNWLDEIDKKIPLFQYFETVFNSYHIKKSKRDKSVFRDVCSKLGVKPHEVLFIDDNLGNIQRAQEEGLKTIHFKTVEDFKYKIRDFIDQAP